MRRNQSQMPCARFWRHFDFLEKLSRLLGLQKLLPRSTLHLVQVEYCPKLESVRLFVHRITAEIKTEDAVYVLAYSVIMLNTDLHNPQIRVRSFYFLYAFFILQSYRNA
jgi:hypothetical protein